MGPARPLSPEPYLPQPVMWVLSSRGSLSPPSPASSSGLAPDLVGLPTPSGSSPSLTHHSAPPSFTSGPALLPRASDLGLFSLPLRPPACQLTPQLFPGRSSCGPSLPPGFLHSLHLLFLCSRDSSPGLILDNKLHPHHHCIPILTPCICTQPGQLWPKAVSVHPGPLTGGGTGRVPGCPPL